MIEWIGAHIAVSGPWLVAAMTMMETALVIGVVLPAEATLLVATVFALKGHFSFATVALAAVTGAALGDSVGFMMGRLGGRRLLRGQGPLSRRLRRHENRTQALFDKHPGVAVSLARLIPFVRTLMPLAAGSMRFSYRRFLLFDLLGILAWATVSLIWAYATARGWQLGMESLGLGWTLFAMVVIGAGLLLLKERITGGDAPAPSIVVGLTGNVASGKSSVAEVWRKAGVPVVSADALARDVVKPGSPGLEAVVEAFGEGVLAGDGELDRAAVRGLIFQDEDARRRLEAILHPRIGVLRDRWIRERMSEAYAVLVSEIPLLFEVGLAGEFDLTVMVDAEEDTRLERLVRDRGLDTDEARRVMAAQMDPRSKRELADHVLDNNGTLDDLEEAAFGLVAELRGAGRAASGPPPGRIRIDMHMHTWASFDCLSDPERVLERARARGVGRIAITDHNCLATALEMAEAYPDEVIPGEEVKTEEGIDVIGLYLQEEIPKGTPAREVCERVRDQGGLVYLPHPYASGKGASGRYAEELAPWVDVIEVFNARLHPGRLNEPGEELAARWSKPRGAGSDAHTVREVAGAFIEVEAHANEPGVLLAAMEHARVRGTTTPWAVHLASTWAKVRKHLPHAPRADRS